MQSIIQYTRDVVFIPDGGGGEISRRLVAIAVVVGLI